MEIKIVGDETTQEKLEEIDVDTYLKDKLSEAVYDIFSEAELTGKIGYSVTVQEKELIFGTINMEEE